MEMRMPDGHTLREEFDTPEKLFERFGELSAKGGKLVRAYFPTQTPTARDEPQQRSGKYVAHQGQREIDRRLAQLERQEEKRLAELLKA